MSSRRRRPDPPSGQPPPLSAAIGDGPAIDLHALAVSICERYRGEYPDELERYGEAGHLWCIHDNQHILNWAAGAVNGIVDFEREIAWLARILEARDFPLDRLARSMEIGAEETDEPALAGRLREGAEFVRSTGSFLRQP